MPVDSVLVTTRATIGAVARARVPMTTNQGFQNLVPRAGTDAAWLFHAIEEARPVLRSLAAGSTFKEVSRESLRKLQLLVAPPTQQRAIATALDAIDDVVATSALALASAEGARKALLHTLCTRGLPGQHTHWTAPTVGVPSCWPVMPLGEVLRLEYGEPLREDARVPGPVVVYGSSGPIGSHNVAVVRGPGIVVGRKGSIGRVSWTTHDFYPIDTTYYVTANYERADLRWIYHTLSRENLARLSRATGVPGLNRDDVLRLVRPIPPIDEQRAIAAAVDAVGEVVDAMAQALEGTRALKAATATALLTGLVRVTSPTGLDESTR